MKARFHQRLLNHKPSIKITIAIEPNSVTSGDQRRIRYEISIVRDVCALNGGIRKTGVNTVVTTATTSTNTIRYEISIVRDVCALNGAIRKTGVNTVVTTATTSTNTISQTSLRLALVHSDNRVRRLGMPGSGSIFNLAHHRHGPQYADGEKRQ